MPGMVVKNGYFVEAAATAPPSRSIRRQSSQSWLRSSLAALAVNSNYWCRSSQLELTATAIISIWSAVKTNYCGRGSQFWLLGIQ
jgi:hypothetical protein